MLFLCGRKLVDDFDAHITGGAGDDLDTSGLILGIHVGPLELPDFGELLGRDLADLVLVGLGRTTGDIRGLFQEDARRGDLRMKVKLLSLNTVMTTGKIIPFWSFVRALKSLQNAMMLTPCAPRAGPTGARDSRHRRAIEADVTLDLLGHVSEGDGCLV